MNIYLEVKKLAKSSEYQNIFNAAKEINGIQLFKNNVDFSHIQNLFISYLRYYDSLFKDIVIKDLPKYISKKAIYEDSYMLWKQKNEFSKDQKENKKKKGLHIKFSPEIHHKRGNEKCSAN
jgi:hypothetical protein